MWISQVSEPLGEPAAASTPLSRGTYSNKTSAMSEEALPLLLKPSCFCFLCLLCLVVGVCSLLPQLWRPCAPSLHSATYLVLFPPPYRSSETLLLCHRCTQPPPVSLCESTRSHTLGFVLTSRHRSCHLCTVFLSVSSERGED